ncbi:hypothetical protein [Rhodopirellula bahusiensis]|uniref:Uncharacterized protein n=1 Tax=Rhodopirellula bahusiensis TaxID=2014065 RepID=A0A2G1W2T7_9BACT|nr:hypothetical protein [Rhodopirellula bahusiensis]PHQ33305.1 hypothetical protein CEE69_21515 [Rhodopirellula bahusiensis]
MSRYRFTLYALFCLVTGVAAFFGLVRFLVRQPEMLTPIVTVFVFLGCVLSPGIASRRDSARNRMTLGCLVLPLFFVVCGFAFSVVILMLSRGG